MPQVAVAYLRVSTAEQVKDGVSLDAQLRKIEAWCEVNDYSLTAVYRDAGISGANVKNRPEISKAIDHATRTKGALVVYSLSRLSRSTRDTISIGEKLDNAGADLVSLSERIDTTSAAGRMIFRMLAVLAEFEREQISERTTMALQHKKSKGQRVGTIPFGFDLSGDGQTLSPNTVEQNALDVIVGMRRKGFTLRAIAQEMDRRNLPTKSNKSKWDHSTIARILSRAKCSEAHSKIG